MTQVSSLYLHVPFCRHLCNYCDFYKLKFDETGSQFESFHQFLRASWERHEKLLEDQGMSWAPLETIYLGGGTPSLWGAMGADVFREVFLQRLETSFLEFTMEVDPGTWNREMIGAWKKLGLNRISIGTQTLDPRFLKIMDRVHSLDESRELLRFCQQENPNFSLDFLLGIPDSEVLRRDIRAELDELLSYSPTHVSLYILNARSKYPLIERLPTDEYIREEYLLVSDYLRGKGFHHYEVSNFALPGFESRHNLRYWQGNSVAAFGPTGTGYFSRGPSSAFRYAWKVMAPEVQPEELGEKEISLERIYLGLRTSSGWTPEHPGSALIKVFSRWEKAQYGHWDGKTMTLSALGFVMLDSLMDELFSRKLA